MHWSLLPSLAFLALTVQGSPLSATNQLEVDFQELKTLQVGVLHDGTGEKGWARFRALRDSFAQGGDAAADFLIGKLRKMNSEEALYEKDLNDVEGGMSYIVAEVDEQKDGLAKYAVCLILADIFPKVTTATQARILSTLQESYMPSDYGRESMQFLHYAMWRSGKNAMPALLDLAFDHPAELVRCGVSSGLNSALEDIRKNNPQLKPFPPALDCRASTEQRQLAAAGWRRWWSGHGRDVTAFPVLPSFFDLPHDKPSQHPNIP